MELSKRAVGSGANPEILEWGGLELLKNQFTVTVKRGQRAKVERSGVWGGGGASAPPLLDR